MTRSTTLSQHCLAIMSKIKSMLEKILLKQLRIWTSRRWPGSQVLSNSNHLKCYQLLWDQSIQSLALALIGAPASGRWDWSPRISRGACKLAQARSYQISIYELRFSFFFGCFIDIACYKFPHIQYHTWHWSDYFLGSYLNYFENNT